MSRAPAGARPGTRPPGEVRLIGGQWKRSKLAVPARPGLRPTPDRVRETLYNWLGQDLSGWRVLDAFAGSGALGLEAASRGAAEAVLLDRDPALVQAIRAVAQRLKATTVRAEVADALRWMGAAAPGGFDLVLLDPPFDAGLHGPALAVAPALVAPRGWLYVEAAESWVQRAPAGFALHRHARAGAVQAHLFRRSDNPESALPTVPA